MWGAQKGGQECTRVFTKKVFSPKMVGAFVQTLVGENI